MAENLTITVHRLASARKAPWRIELQCAEGWAFLPFGDMAVRMVISEIAGVAAHQPATVYFTLGGHGLIWADVTVESYARQAAGALARIPDAWLAHRNDADTWATALAADPLAAACRQLLPQQRELAR